jgi:hypothetical protein
VRQFLLALSLLLAAPCWAQSEEKLFAAGKVLELVGPTLAQAVIAVELCGIGDATPWKKAVAAIDRRHARCIAQDATWKKLTEKPDALAGTFAFDAFMSTRGAEARAQGAASYCGRVPWKMVLVPGAATEQAKEAFLREQPKIPRAAFDEFVAWADWVRALGDDPRWVDAPCTEFWPAWPR